jgi:hypothetical protein
MYFSIKQAFKIHTRIIWKIIQKQSLSVLRRQGPHVSRRSYNENSLSLKRGLGTQLCLTYKTRLSPMSNYEQVATTFITGRSNMVLRGKKKILNSGIKSTSVMGPHIASMHRFATEHTCQQRLHCPSY